MTNSVEVRDLTVEYTRGDYVVRVLDRLTLDVERGSLVLLLGPSGCGKTTLLSCLAAIQRPTSGQINVHGKEVTSLSGAALTQYRRAGVGIVFQAFNLVASLDATENVMIPMRAAGVPRRESRATARRLLAEVGLADRAGHRPASLSGGQQQRVGIARALALDPSLVIADEPTAALDHVQVESVLRILRGLADKGRTIIVSTHDHRLLELADRVVELAPANPMSGTPVVARVLATDEILFEEGQRSDRIFVVERGSVELSRAIAESTDRHVLAVATAGEVFGEMGPVFGLPRSATARAVSDSEVVGYTVAEFKRQFGVPRLMSLVARFAGGADG